MARRTAVPIARTPLRVRRKEAKDGYALSTLHILFHIYIHLIFMNYGARTTPCYSEPSFDLNAGRYGLLKLFPRFRVKLACRPANLEAYENEGC